MAENVSGERPDMGALSAQMIGQMDRDAGMGVSNEFHDSDQCDDIDPLSGPAFGPLFLELLLQCIIAGHPRGNKTERQRLDAAMKALTGRKSSGNPFADDKDDQALLWMKTRELELQRKGAPSSNSELARAAATKFLGWQPTDEGTSDPDRLREKFSGAYQRKQFEQKTKRSRTAVPPPDVPRTLAYRAVHHDYVVESIERQILRRIVAELRQAGVAAILPEE
jgi:hypothetical protein